MLDTAHPSESRFAAFPPSRMRAVTDTTAYKHPLQYNWQVTKSFVKQVYQAEGLAPPLHLSQWTSAYSEIFHKAASKQWWQQVLSNGSWAKLAIGVSTLWRTKTGWASWARGSATVFARHCSQAAQHTALRHPTNSEQHS